MLIIEPRMVSIFWACTLMFVKHVSFLESRPTETTQICDLPMENMDWTRIFNTWKSTQKPEGFAFEVHYVGNLNKCSASFYCMHFFILFSYSIQNGQYQVSFFLWSVDYTKALHIEMHVHTSNLNTGCYIQFKRMYPPLFGWSLIMFRITSHNLGTHKLLHNKDQQLVVMIWCAKCRIYHINGIISHAPYEGPLLFKLQQSRDSLL